MTGLTSITLESNFIQGILIFPDSASSIRLLAVVELMSQIVNSIVDIVEVALAFLCNRQIQPVPGFPVRVHMFPKNQRRTKSVKYGYGVATENNIIRFG